MSIKFAPVLLAAALVGCVAPTVPTDPADDALSALGGELREFDLFVTFGPHEPVAGKTLPALTFTMEEGSGPVVPGPEIRVKEGDRVRVRLHDAHHTIHWHGVSVPWAMDGVPWMTQEIGPGQYVYEFVATETGTYWYHCHVEAPIHVDLGMFGAFIVEPRDPSVDPPFDREATLILHEADSQIFQVAEVAFFGGGPQFIDPPAHPGEAAGWAQSNANTMTDIAGLVAGGATGTYPFGSVGPREYHPQPSLRYKPKYDTFMINGKSFPETEPVHIQSGETLRLRLINAGQLPHALHLHGHKMLVTHKDGSLLPAPYHADTIGLFPGERYDVYVRGTNAGIWDLHDHSGQWGAGAFSANDGAFVGGMNTMLVYEDFELAKLPVPVEGRTSGDYVVFAPSYKGWPQRAQASEPATFQLPAGAASQHAGHEHPGSQAGNPATAGTSPSASPTAPLPDPVSGPLKWARTTWDRLLG